MDILKVIKKLFNGWIGLNNDNNDNFEYSPPEKFPQIHYEEKEKDFLEKLRHSYAIPVSIKSLIDVVPFDVKEKDIDNLLRINEFEKDIFCQSLLAYSWHSYTLSIMGSARILDKVVDLLLKQEDISPPKKPNPPESADEKICKECKLNIEYYGGLSKKIKKLSDEAKDIEQIPEELINVVKKISQSAKHPSKLVFDVSDARLVLAQTLHLLKYLNNNKRQAI